MNTLFLLAVFVIAFAISAFTTLRMIPKLKAAGLTGKDMHKAGQPDVAEMGGIAIIIGLVGAAIAGMVLHSFFGFQFRLPEMLAALLTVCIIAIIGIFDDLLDMRQSVKAFLPLAAAVPLIAVEMVGGNSTIVIPFFGAINFGILYPLLLIPLAVAVCSNLTNMLAGYNGMEAGLGALIFAALAILAFLNGQTEMAILSVAMLGALLGFLPFNWFPAKVFIGDVGALTIGATLAAAVIISSLKSAGAILVIPFVIDFFLKAANRFPKSFAALEKDGKLHAPAGKTRGLADLVLNVCGGMKEKNLVLAVLGIELVFVVIVLAMFAKI